MAQTHGTALLQDPSIRCLISMMRPGLRGQRKNEFWFSQWQLISVAHGVKEDLW